MTTIKLKNGSGAPTSGDLAQGEPALDLTNKRLYTEDSGGTVIEVGTNPGVDVTFADNRKALFGTGSDLEIYHDGSHSYIKDNGTGNLRLQGATTVQITDPSFTSYSAQFNPTGAATLYHNNSAKLATTATGIDVTGTAVTDGLTMASGSQATIGVFGTSGLQLIGTTGGDNIVGTMGSSEPLIFRTVSAERMRIDASGNVGINNTSPSTTLEVTGTGDAETGITATHSRSGVGYTLLLNNTNNGANKGSGIKWQSGGFDTGAIITRSDATAASGDAPAYMTFHTSSDGSEDLAERMRIKSDGEVEISGIGNTAGARLNIGSDANNAFLRSYSTAAGLLLGTTNAQPLKIMTNSGEVARFDASGNLLVGTTTDAGASGANAVSIRTTGSRWSRNTTSTAGQINFYNPNGEVGSISTSGSATSYNTSSDQRLKDNIVDAPSASDDIDAIQVRSFDWKADGSHQKYGMVAQELQTVAPEAVTGDADSDDMMGVDYSKLVPMLVKEIQSLRARVAQLETN